MIKTLEELIIDFLEYLEIDPKSLLACKVYVLASQERLAGQEKQFYVK